MINITKVGKWGKRSTQLSIIVCLLAMLTIGNLAYAFDILEPEVQHPMVGKLVAKLLQQIHYEKYNVNDSISVKQYRQYLNILDHNRSFFLASDIRRFERFKYQFDDNLNLGNLDPAYYIFNIF